MEDVRALTLQSTLATLRKELEALEAQYAAMLVHQPSARDDENSPAMQKYLELTELKNRYRAENQQLYDLNAEFTKTEDRIGQLMDSAEPLPEPSVSEFPRFHVTPLPEAEYAKIIAEARDDVVNFAYSTEKLSTGARVLGWTDQRKIQGNELKFGLEKEFPGISAYELLQRSWPIFSSPEVFPKIYSAQIEVKFHVLQHVNEDTVLFYRVIRSPAVVDRLVKTVFLLARVRIAEGYMLLFKSIDKDRVRFREDEIAQVLEEIHSMSSSVTSSESLVTNAGPAEVWVDKYIWVLFQDRGATVGGHKDKKCLFHFGGSTVTNIWLQEVLFIALRWESMAVGPLFTIPSE